MDLFFIIIFFSYTSEIVSSAGVIRLVRTWPPHLCHLIESAVSKATGEGTAFGTVSVLRLLVCISFFLVYLYAGHAPHCPRGIHVQLSSHP